MEKKKKIRLTTIVLCMFTIILTPISGTATHDDTKTTTPQKKVKQYVQTNNEDRQKELDLLFGKIIGCWLRQTVPQHPWVVDINKTIQTYTGMRHTIVKQKWKEAEKEAQKLDEEWRKKYEEVKKLFKFQVFEKEVNQLPEKKNFVQAKKNLSAWKSFEKANKHYLEVKQKQKKVSERVNEAINNLSEKKNHVKFMEEGSRAMILREEEEKAWDQWVKKIEEVDEASEKLPEFQNFKKVINQKPEWKKCYELMKGPDEVMKKNRKAKMKTHEAREWKQLYLLSRWNSYTFDHKGEGHWRLPQNLYAEKVQELW